MTLDRDIEIGVKVEICLEIIVMTEIEAETEVGIEMDKHKIGPQPCQMTEENQDPGPTLESVLIEIDRDVIDVMSPDHFAQECPKHTHG